LPLIADALRGENPGIDSESTGVRVDIIKHIQEKIAV
jgi:hypothetical protein